MWSNSYWKLTEDWQKDSCRAKGVIKMHTESGRKKEKQSGQELCPWEGTQKRRWLTRVKSLPGEWVVWAIYWVSQPWGPNQEDESPWLVGGLVEQEECGRSGLCSWGTCTHSLTPETGWRGWTETAWDSGQFPAAAPAHAWGKHLLWLRLPHKAALHWSKGCSYWGESSFARDKDGSDPERAAS